MKVSQLNLAPVVLVAALLAAGLSACQQAEVEEKPPQTESATDDRKIEEAAPGIAADDALAAQTEDDGIIDQAEPYAVGMAGPYHLWEDTEGGTVCDLDLYDTPILGGYGLKIDNACVQKLELDGEMYAWFVDPSDQALVIIDAARQAIVRLPHDEGLTYYMQRNATRANGLMLEPRDM